MKGKKGAKVIKLNLEKAYDKLEWNFVQQILFFFYVPQRRDQFNNAMYIYRFHLYAPKWHQTWKLSTIK